MPQSFNPSDNQQETCLKIILNLKSIKIQLNNLEVLNIM